MGALDRIQESVAIGTMILESLTSVFQGWEPLQYALQGLEVISLRQRFLQGNKPLDYNYFLSKNIYYDMFLQNFL